MFQSLSALVLAFATVSFISSLAFAKVDRPQQFVLLAFDGSKNVNFWKESRQFAADADVKFTYFANAVYFLPDAMKTNYIEPKNGAGKSAIGFGGKKADIAIRLEQMQLAMEEGHELASHANGHYDGSSYTRKMWNSEFTQFTSLFTDAWKNSGVQAQQPNWWSDYFATEVIGFRAPQLGVGEGLWGALQDHNFLYDTSRVDKMGYWPRKLNGVWNFPLAGLPIAGTTKKTLSMDYNFYVSQSKGVDGPESKFAEYEEQMYKSYMGYFNNNYYGNRAPIHIGHHFSKWNGGAYWNAMKRFTESVCTQPEVVCGTYKDLLAFMVANEKNIDAYQKADFTKLANPNGGSQNLSSVVKELTDAELLELSNSVGNHFNAHEGE